MIRKLTKISVNTDKISYGGEADVSHIQFQYFSKPGNFLHLSLFGSAEIKKLSYKLEARGRPEK